jgi:hypothetical protein
MALEFLPLQKFALSPCSCYMEWGGGNLKRPQFVMVIYIYIYIYTHTYIYICVCVCLMANVVGIKCNARDCFKVII